VGPAWIGAVGAEALLERAGGQGQDAPTGRRLDGLEVEPAGCPEHVDRRSNLRREDFSLKPPFFPASVSAR
jgi:hypothetical protein